MGDVDSGADSPTPEETPEPAEGETKPAGMSWIPLLKEEARSAHRDAGMRHLLTNPPWWIRDGVVAFVVALVVSGIALAGQNWLADEQNRQAQRLENLRFVRDHSSTDPSDTRHFAGFDLRGQDMSGLELRGADFDRADLRDVDLSQADLSPGRDQDGQRKAASMSHADLTEAFMFAVNLQGLMAIDGTFVKADLSEADLSDAWLPGCDFSGADLSFSQLSGADLDSAILDGADLTFAKYDDETQWPRDFHPPDDAWKVEKP